MFRTKTSTGQKPRIYSEKDLGREPGRKLYMEGSEVPGPGPTHLSVSTFGRVYEIWGRCRALISNWGGPWHRYKLIGQLGSKSGGPSATQTPPHRGQIPGLAKTWFASPVIRSAYCVWCTKNNSEQQEINFRRSLSSPTDRFWYNFVHLKWKENNFASAVWRKASVVGAGTSLQSCSFYPDFERPRNAESDPIDLKFIHDRELVYTLPTNKKLSKSVENSWNGSTKRETAYNPPS